MFSALSIQPNLDARRLAHGPSDGAALRALPPLTRFSFRGGAEAASLAGEAFSTQFSTSACRATRNGARAALWLGPDEWLLEAAEAERASIETSLASALGSLAYSLVYIGHRHAAFALEGTRAADVLAAGCPLDLHETAFVVDMCTRTVLAKAEIVLWRTAPECFTIGVWRSFAPYVWDFLVEARMRL